MKKSICISSSFRRTLVGAFLALGCFLLGSVPSLAATGDVISSFSAPGKNPRGLTWDGTNLWLADADDDLIYELTTTGTVLSSFTTPSIEPTGLTWDGTNLWLSDTSTDRNYELTTTGTELSSFATPNPNATGLTWDGVNLWQVEDSGTHYELTTAGTVLSSFTLCSNCNIFGVAWDGTNLWVVNSSVSWIRETTTTGTVLSFFLDPCGGSTEKGLTFDGTDFWLACDGNGPNNIIYQLEGPPPSAPPPTITLSKSADVATAKPGDTITYTLTYGNTGAGDATNLVITDTIPANTTLVGGSITGGGTESGGVITWNLGPLAAGVTGVTVQFAVTVDTGTLAATSIDNSATANFDNAGGSPQTPSPPTPSVPPSIRWGASRWSRIRAVRCLPPPEAR